MAEKSIKTFAAKLNDSALKLIHIFQLPINPTKGTFGFTLDNSTET